MTHFPLVPAASLDDGFNIPATERAQWRSSNVGRVILILNLAKTTLFVNAVSFAPFSKHVFYAPAGSMLSLSVHIISRFDSSCSLIPY